MKRIELILICVAVLFYCACEKPAKDEQWGISLLYIPQAVVQSGGANNNYNIAIKSSGSNDTTFVVGLYRSGLAPLNGATVDLAIDTDSLANAITIAQQPDAAAAYDIYKNAKLLDPEYYTIPDKISLKDGERETYVEITLNKQALLADPDFGDFSFILPVRIQNPTNYELNESLSLVMFIIEKQ